MDNKYKTSDKAHSEPLQQTDVSGSTGLKVKGYIHNHPIYDKNGNWNTDVEYGDMLVVGFTGFGSECLKYGHRYVVIFDNGETKLRAENGDIIDAWNTKNTMPFFVKLLREYCH